MSNAPSGTMIPDRRRIRREIVERPSRRRVKPTTARGRLMFPKPRTKRQTRLEWESAHGIAKETASTAEHLLEEIMKRLHVTGLNEERSSRAVLLQLALPEDLFRDLCLFGIEREDLEPETDTGVDDIGEEDRSDWEPEETDGNWNMGDEGSSESLAEGLQLSSLFVDSPKEIRLMGKNLITGESEMMTRRVLDSGVSIQERA